MTTPQVLPGDFGLLHNRGPVDKLIGAAEVVDELVQGRGWTRSSRDALYRHAFGVERVDADGTVHAVEAWPSGARRHTYRLDDPAILWSSGHFDLTDGQRRQIVAWWVDHLGAGYAWDAYLRQAAVRLRVPFAASALARQIEERHEFICSQWIDCGWQAGSYPLFADRRAPYDVAPSDLADLLGA